MDEWKLESGSVSCVMSVFIIHGSKDGERTKGQMEKSCTINLRFIKQLGFPNFTPVF